VEGTVFSSPRLDIPTRSLHLVPLHAEHAGISLRCIDGGITFTERGWYEVLLTVAWDATNTQGTRFAHTAIPDKHPLHSEAINAAVLAELSSGKQLLRGNTIFAPGEVDHISLEVWHDADKTVQILGASLEIRELADAKISP
jgi:hypothetical protein